MNHYTIAKQIRDDQEVDVGRNEGSGVDDLEVAEDDQDSRVDNETLLNRPTAEITRLPEAIGAYAVNDSDDKPQSDTLVVEGKRADDSQLKRQKRKVLMYLLLIGALVVVIAAVVVPVVILTQGSSNPNGQPQPTSSPSGAPSFRPSSSPTTSLPSMTPSTGSPTSLAFDSVVEQLGLDNVPADPNHPVHRAIEWMATTDTLPPTLQRFAVVVVYYAMGGEEWANQLGFLNATSRECDNWVRQVGPIVKGIRCFADEGIVGTIELVENGARGYIPSEIRYLSRLIRVELDNNFLTGTIPNELAALPNLSFFSALNNRLEGTLPVQFSGSMSLVVLVLAVNQLTGSIPSEYSNISSLVLLDVTSNMLTGTIPETIGMLINLAGLATPFNLLSGTIPSSLGNAKSLSVASFGYNLLSGSIPTEFELLSQLVLFGCQFNDMTGSLPFSPMSALENIDVSNNRLTGGIESIARIRNLTGAEFSNNQFTGSLPVEFCDRERLRILAFLGNKLVGTIHDCIDRLTNLNILLLQNNSLIGTIPQLPLSLETVLLGSNDLSGGIEQFGMFPVLELLLLSRNRLTGTIPSTLGAPGFTTAIQLAENAFTGTIPTEIGQLSRLTSLNVQGNSFMGGLPVELNALTMLNDLQIQLNELAGDLTTLCDSNTGDGRFLADCEEVICPCCLVCCDSTDFCNFT